MITLPIIIKESITIISSRKNELLPYFLVFFIAELVTSFQVLYLSPQQSLFTVLATLLFVYISLVGGMMYYYKLKHQDVAFKKSFFAVQPMLLTIFIATLLLVLGIAFGLLLLVIPGLILIAGWSIVFPIILFEKKGIFEACKESMKRTKGSRYPILFNFFFFIFLSILANLPFGAKVETFFSALVLSFLVAGVTLYYNTSTYLIYTKLSKNSESV